MATRFYFSSTLVPDISPAFAVNWDGTAEGVYRVMMTNPDDSTITGFQVFAGNNHAASIRRIAVSFVSPPMAAGNAFSTSDTLKMVASCSESDANDNINRMPILLKVWDSTGTTVRATLKAIGHHGPSTTEWILSSTSRMPLDGDTVDNSYTTVAGDRLGLEVGGQVSAAGGTSVQGAIYFGAPRSGTDQAESEGVLTGTSARPWFEISRDITFLNSLPCFHRQPRFFRQKG